MQSWESGSLRFITAALPAQSAMPRTAEAEAGHRSTPHDRESARRVARRWRKYIDILISYRSHAETKRAFAARPNAGLV